MPTFLRLGAGILLFLIGYQTLKVNKDSLIKFFEKEKYPLPKYIVPLLGSLEIIFGGFLILGFSTQVSALVAIYICINLMVFRVREPKFSIVELFGLGLMILICFTLVITGAGLFAVDVPL